MKWTNTLKEKPTKTHSRRNRMHVNYIYGSDGFAMYTHIESLCCIPETNIMLYVSYISIFLKWKKQVTYQLYNY